MDLPGGDTGTMRVPGAAEPPKRKAAPYIFHGQTTSLCETCLEPVPAKIIIEDERVFYLKTYRNPKVRSVDLRKIDFSCAKPTGMLDAHAGLAGDVTAAFHDYSHDEAEAHMLKALAYFRPTMTPDTVRQVLALFESFACEPAK